MSRIAPLAGLVLVVGMAFGALVWLVGDLLARDVVGSEPFRTFSGRLYEQPGVLLVVDEGRSFLRRSREHYDLVIAAAAVFRRSSREKPRMSL